MCGAGGCWPCSGVRRRIASAGVTSALDQELARGQRRRQLFAREDPHRPERRLERMALAFTLPDTDGTPIPLHVDGAPAAVVVFTCNHCPYALAWHERIQDVARDYADRGVRVPADQRQRRGQATRATRWRRCRRGSRRASSPRPTCTTRRRRSPAPGAPRRRRTCSSPTRSGVVYRGAPDADHGDPSLNAAWLRAALDDVLAGRPVASPETKPVGCSIKWK